MYGLAKSVYVHLRQISGTTIYRMAGLVQLSEQKDKACFWLGKPARPLEIQTATMCPTDTF